jgi:hypothetical protein
MRRLLTGQPPEIRDAREILGEYGALAALAAVQAAGVGFEPTVPREGHSGFQVGCLEVR